jgi:8-oxo-dGTP diphosphatase
MSYTYNYPRPAVTVDALLFYKDERKVLLIQRKHEPFMNSWAIPGGFVDENETLETAALRELKEETSISGVQLLQFRAYGNPGRDPRGRTISVVFYAVLDYKPEAMADDDAKDFGWFSVKELPAMAFDHKQIITEALEFIPNL